MSKPKLKRPAPGTVLGALALIVAVAGNANALAGGHHTLVHRGDIAKGAVTARALANGAVHPKALAKGVVTAKALHAGAVTATASGGGLRHRQRDRPGLGPRLRPRPGQRPHHPNRRPR